MGMGHALDPLSAVRALPAVLACAQRVEDALSEIVVPEIQCRLREGWITREDVELYSAGDDWFWEQIEVAISCDLDERPEREVHQELEAVAAVLRDASVDAPNDPIERRENLVAVLIHALRFGLAVAFRKELAEMLDISLPPLRVSGPEL
jgi:hypothetical protein